jgi:hypothetical protein
VAHIAKRRWWRDSVGLLIAAAGLMLVVYAFYL